MLKSNFLLALRALIRNKFYTVLNVTGLVAGLCTGVFILLWVQDERSFDRFHTDAERIARVNCHFDQEGATMNWSTTPFPLAIYAQETAPGVEQSLRFSPRNSNFLVETDGQVFVEKSLAFTDPEFFTFFNFPLTQGDASNPFPDAQSVVLTERLAQKYFSTANPVGKTLKIGDVQRTVTGVVRNFPENSTLRADLLLPTKRMSANFRPNDYWKSLETNWGDHNCQTFLRLHPDADRSAIARQLTDLHYRNNSFLQASGGKMTYSLQPLPTLHFTGADGKDTRSRTVNMLFWIAMTIIIVAAINYVNWSTARAAQKAPEVGLRKVLGAGRLHLFRQFFAESALTVGTALLLTLPLLWFLLPLYNQLTGKSIEPGWDHAGVLLGAAGLMWAVAGLYPALSLSAMPVMQVARTHTSTGGGLPGLRRALVVFQFVISIGLIASALVVRQQLRYISEMRLGYDKENVLVCNMGEMEKHYDAVRAELLGQPGVRSVEAATGSLLQGLSSTGDTDWEGKAPDKQFVTEVLMVSPGFREMMHLEMAQGEWFSGTPADSVHFMLNETAVKTTGLTDPIGKRFKLWQREGTIIGVVRDFHVGSVREKIPPVVISPPQNGMAPYTLFVKTTVRDAQACVAAVESQWKKFNPRFPFEYQFLDETFDKLHREEARLGNLLDAFALVAVLLCVLGLLGLAAFTAERRTKEIGIRKVLGASVGSIAGMLTRDFLKLVSLALLLAAPVAWWAMNRWLSDFAYRIAIGWQVFALAGIIAVVVAFLTVSSQAIKAAVANPVKSLRNE